jgi:hypothetical protein
LADSGRICCQSRIDSGRCEAFPYLLAYDAGATPPRILRVLHTARDLPEALADLEP